MNITGSDVIAIFSTPSRPPDHVPGKLDQSPRLHKTLDVLTAQLETRALKRRDEFELLGWCLFDYLFEERVAQRLLAWLVSLPPDQPVRIVLEFEAKDSSQAIAYPWEYLFIPSGPRRGFVAADEQLILTRQILLEDGMAAYGQQPPTAEKLRILVGIASPAKERGVRWKQPEDKSKIDLTPSDLNAVLPVAEDLVRALRSSTADLMVDRALTVKSLRQALETFRPHVLHIVAHGDVRNDDAGRFAGGGLALCSPEDDRLAAWTMDTDLADAMGHLPGVVFLHACKSAETRQVQGFRGVAMRLVEAGVPAVVAMNFEVEAGVAQRFAIEFYEELAKGVPIDRAVQLGRRTLGTTGGATGNYSNREFGSPVAFVQVPGALILPTEQEASAAVEPTDLPVQSPMTQCPGCYRMVPRTIRMHAACKTRVAPCPNPDCAHLWSPDAGLCEWCGYSAAAEPAGAAGSSTTSALPPQEPGGAVKTAPTFTSAAEPPSTLAGTVLEGGSDG